jgi:hypothetical protein
MLAVPAAFLIFLSPAVVCARSGLNSRDQAEALAPKCETGVCTSGLRAVDRFGPPTFRSAVTRAKKEFERAFADYQLFAATEGDPLALIAKCQLARAVSHARGALADVEECMRVEARFELAHGYRCLICDEIERMRTSLDWVEAPLPRDRGFVDVDGSIASIVRDESLDILPPFVLLMCQAPLKRFDDISAEALTVLEGKPGACCPFRDVVVDFTSESRQFLADSVVESLDNASLGLRQPSKTTLNSMGDLGFRWTRANSSFYSQFRQDWWEKLKAELDSDAFWFGRGIYF